MKECDVMKNKSFFFVFLTWRSGSALILSCTADGSYNLPRVAVLKELQESIWGGKIELGVFLVMSIEVVNLGGKIE